MGLFDSVLKHNETLFKNELVFDYEYLPHILKFRENQQQHIATVIKPLLTGRMGSNLLITGKPGIGKTAACRHVLREMEKEATNVIPLYVNCWKHETAYKVIVQLCDQIGYKWIQNKKTDELMKEIAKVVNKKAAVIVLDEVDKLKEEQVLYQLLEDIYKKCIIMISNEKDFLSYLDQRTRSRLLPEVLEFEPYTMNETRQILAERRDWGFFPGVLDDENLDPLVEQTVDCGDLRVGLFLLRECANAAENRSSRKIEMVDVEKAIAKVGAFRASKLVLDEEEKEILQLIKENNSVPSAVVCALYQEKYNKSERTFRRKVSSLRERGMIVSTDGKDEKGGMCVFLSVT